MGAYRAGLVLAAPKPEAATLFYAYETIIEQIVDARAVDLEWPWQVHMVRGLLTISTVGRRAAS
jgi:hypothetical protein